MESDIAIMAANNSNARNLETARLMARLASDTIKLINTHFTEDNISISKRERDYNFWLHMVLKLACTFAYREKLIFKLRNTTDELATVPGATTSLQGQLPRIPSQVLTYAQHLFARRVGLANKQGKNPTDVHILLQQLINQATNSAWYGSVIERRIGQTEQTQDIFFRPVANVLKAQRHKLNGQLGKGSGAKTMQSQYGDFFLITQQNAVCVAEEMSLYGAIEGMPFPIRTQQVSFSKTIDGAGKNISQQLKDILEDINKLYGLVVSCGLDPEIWLLKIATKSSQNATAEEEPSSFSHVKELRLAIKHYLAKKNAKSINWQEQREFIASYQAAKLARDERNAAKPKPPKKPPAKFAGFSCAENCYQFFVSHILPNYYENKLQSFDDATITHQLAQSDRYDSQDWQPDDVEDDDLETDENDFTSAALSYFENAQANLTALDRVELAEVHDTHPYLFNPVTAYVWERTVASSHTFSELISDAHFQRHLQHYAELGYTQLTLVALEKKLMMEIKEILASYQQINNQQQLEELEQLNAAEEKEFANFHRHFSERFNPVIACFLQLTISEGRSVSVALNDQQFLTTIQRHPELGYDQLAPWALQNKLETDINTQFENFKQ